MAPSGNKLEVTTPSDREIASTRIFDAPRELVFEAHSSCEHMSNWWGPRRYEVSSCEMDFRPGGTWRIVHKGSEGEIPAFRGEFREIVRPERIVWTFEWEGMPGHVLIESAAFEDVGGRTRVTTTLLFHTTEERDGMLSSGMETGMSESHDRLAELLAKTA